MPTITIDDKVCQFEGKKTILQVASENGIEIPHYCYHPSLTVTASCRICLAEVAQPNPRNDNKVELIPKLLPTCQTPAIDGSEVYTKSEKAAANQKHIMEYLLINHPLDCPVCDQAGECSLQDYSYRYGHGYSRFEDEKIKQPKKDIGPHVLLYSDRCIMCTRCVRVTREITGTNELCVTGRGNGEQIDTFPGKALDNDLSACVVDLCPVGALLDKEFLFEQRVWFLTSTPSIDGLTASGDNLWIDHNNGQVYRFKPRTNMEVNQWWTSDEIRYSWKQIDAEKRLTWPTIKGEEKPTWNEAISAVATGLKSAAKKGGKLLAMISPMLSCEDAWQLAKAARAIDADAVLAMGPVVVEGEDKTFGDHYTVYAEKAPNVRGVRQVLESVAGVGKVLDYAAAMEKLQSDKKELTALLLTGNYFSDWTNDALMAVSSSRFTVLLDSLPSKLTDVVDVVLPTAIWLEKSGSFMNHAKRLQSFNQAIAPVEFARAEAQIGLDLLAACGASEPMRYNVDQTRVEMGDELMGDIHHPPVKELVKQETTEFVEL